MISPYDAFLSAWRDCERYSRASRRSEACADSARSRVVSHMHIGWQAHAGVMRGLMRGSCGGPCGGFHREPRSADVEAEVGTKVIEPVHHLMVLDVSLVGVGLQTADVADCGAAARSTPQSGTRWICAQSVILRRARGEAVRVLAAACHGASEGVGVRERGDERGERGHERAWARERGHQRVGMRERGHESVGISALGVRDLCMRA